MTTIDRAVEIVDALAGAGLRATLDPSAVTPPAVLVVPPTRTYDVACGFTATWTLVAVAPGAQGADRTTWGLLDGLVDGIAGVIDIERAELATYTLNGAGLPAYVCTFNEAH